MSSKKTKGQFYTTKSSYILDGLSLPPQDCKCVMEPFAGKGDLIEWLRQKEYSGPIVAYDIDPKCGGTTPQDTLLNPPDYTDSWILTNPPYLARNKCSDKTVYDKYKTNDLYKCFILSLTQQNNYRGGIMIIPAGFFFSPRPVDIYCRDQFMKKNKIIGVRYFEEQVFDDTPTTVVAIVFERSMTELKVQDVEWERYPTKDKKVFRVSADSGWIIGGDIYTLPISPSISIRRSVEGQELKECEQQTYMTLRALDSGSQGGRLGMEYKKDYIYPAKESSRTYATMRLLGKTLSETEQMTLCKAFNDFVEKKREETWSLFLPQYRESKEYARKRMPFQLAYRILLHLMSQS